MAIWTVELKGWGDYGDTHFNVIAKSRSDAWNRACELEDYYKIARIYLVRELKGV